jgi:hypothetical protein
MLLFDGVRPPTRDIDPPDEPISPSPPCTSTDPPDTFVPKPPDICRDPPVDPRPPIKLTTPPALSSVEDVELPASITIFEDNPVSLIPPRRRMSPEVTALFPVDTTILPMMIKKILLTEILHAVESMMMIL